MPAVHSQLPSLPEAGSRNVEIECLRALAVIGVVFHHMQGNLFNPGLASLDRLRESAQGWWGVDLFFAISGFVIARSFMPRVASAGPAKARWHTVVAFWIRRCWRLWPSAWLWLALVLLATLAYNRSGVFGSVHANAMATLAGLFNVANFRFADAFYRYEYGASFVYWSLSLEEQFYLLFPLLAWLLRRRIGWLMAALFLVQMGLGRTPWLMTIRTDALALGVLLALFTASPWHTRLAPRWLARSTVARLCVLLALLAGLSIFASTAMQGWRFRVSAIALLAAILVWLASHDAGYLFRGAVVRRLLGWIGARSYAIYLIHVPTYFFLRESCWRMRHVWPVFAPWLLALVTLTLIGTLAEMNYRWVELPLRRHGRRVADAFEANAEEMPRAVLSETA